MNDTGALQRNSSLKKKEGGRRRKICIVKFCLPAGIEEELRAKSSLAGSSGLAQDCGGSRDERTNTTMSDN